MFNLKESKLLCCPFFGVTSRTGLSRFRKSKRLTKRKEKNGNEEKESDKGEETTVV